MVYWPIVHWTVSWMEPETYWGLWCLSGNSSAKKHSCLLAAGVIYKFELFHQLVSFRGGGKPVFHVLGQNDLFYFRGFPPDIELSLLATGHRKKRDLLIKGMHNRVVHVITALLKDGNNYI